MLQANGVGAQTHDMLQNPRRLLAKARPSEREGMGHGATANLLSERAG